MFRLLSIADKMNPTQTQTSNHRMSPSVFTESPLYAEAWDGPLGHIINRILPP